MTVLQLASPWLFLLLPLPWLLRRVLPGHRRSRPAVRAPFLERLERILGRSASDGSPPVRRLRVQWALLALTWVALVAALARPQWLDEPLVDERPMRDLLLALDLSGSMDTGDFTHADGTRTDRLTAARQVLDGFLARRDGDRVGLVLFGTSAFVQAPFTDDLDVVRELLGETRVRMLGPRTALGDAIGLSIRMFERSEVEQKVLIVLTDGNDTGSQLPPVRAAEIAADHDVVIHAVAMGDPEAAGEQALDTATLEQVAGVTGGRFFQADDRDGLEGVYATLDGLNPRVVETRSYRPRRELFHWPLGAATLLSLAVFALAGVFPARRGDGAGMVAP